MPRVFLFPLLPFKVSHPKAILRPSLRSRALQMCKPQTFLLRNTCFCDKSGGGPGSPVKACKKLQQYRGTPETFTDKVRRDFARLMLPGPCPAVKHIWPRTRLRHARENVAAYLCSYPREGLNGSSAPPRSASESGPDRGCPPWAEPAPNPAAEASAPRHPATRIQLPEMQHQHHVKISKAATHYIPPSSFPPPPLFLLYFLQLSNIFSLVTSHMVSDWRESHQVPVFEAQLCT